MKSLFSVAVLLLALPLFAQHPHDRPLLPEPGQEIFLPTASWPSPTVADRGPTPTWNWMRRSGGSGTDRNAGLVEDAAGNLAVAGFFSGVTEFGAGQTLTSTGTSDAFAAKYTADGSLLWIRQIESPGPESRVVAVDITRDAAGNLYVLGVLFGNALKIGSQSYSGSPGSFFVIKFDGSGGLLWVKLNAVNTTVKRILADAAGNTFVTASKNIYSLTADGLDGWVASPDAGSDFIFGALAMDGATLLVGGVFDTDLTLGTAVLTADNTGFFLGQLDPLSGAFTGGQLIGTGESYYAIDYAVNGLVKDAANNIYLAGTARGNLVFGSLVQNGFFNNSFALKIDSSNDPQWLRTGVGVNNTATNVLLDATGNPIVYGLKFGNLDWSGTALTTEANLGYSVALNAADGSTQWLRSHPLAYAAILTNDGALTQAGANGYDAFLRKADAATGTPVWYKPNVSDSGYGLISSVEVDDTGVYVLGDVGGKADLLGQAVNVPQNAMFVAKTDFQGNLLWSQILPGALSLSYFGEPLALDKAAQKLYCLGTYSGTITIGNQMQTNLTGIRHALLVQLDADGSLNWGVDLGDSDATNLAVDGQGNVLVSGSFEDALDLGSGSLTDAGFGDIYIAKYSADGLLQWNKRAGGEDTEYSCLVSVDGQSNIYFAIESYSVNVDFAGTPAVTLPEGAGQLLLGKLNPDGDLQWVKSHGGTNVPGEESSCFATAIKTDSAGNTYMMGLFGRSNFFGNLLLTSPYAVNNFVAKFGPAGEPLWAKPIRMRRFGINYNELDIDVAGNCYPTGSIRDTVHFDNGLTLARQGTISDGFVAKYANADGNLEWVKTIWGGSIRPRGLAVYNEESLLLGGYFSGLLHYENETLDSRGGQNAFLGLLGPDIMVSADEPVDGLSMLRVYPNPSAGVFQLTTATPIPVDLEVLDTKGTILFRRSAVLTDQAIDLTALPAGVYFVKIMLAGRSEVKQVVIK